MIGRKLHRNVLCDAGPQQAPQASAACALSLYPGCYLTGRAHSPSFVTRDTLRPPYSRRSLMAISLSYRVT